MDFSEQLATQRQSEIENDGEGAKTLQGMEDEQIAEEETKAKEEFNAVYSASGLSDTGASADDYDYLNEYNGGNRFSQDDDGGISLSNKNVKPATKSLAGYDLATGERYTNEYNDPLIEEAVLGLQSSHSNTKTGAPPEDMIHLAKVAKSLLNSDKEFEEFVVQSEGYGMWSGEQRAISWDAAQHSKLTVQDVKDKGARHWKNKSRGEVITSIDPDEEYPYTNPNGILENIDEDELVDSKDWLSNSKSVLEHFNPDVTQGMTDKEINDSALTFMSSFNFNIPAMMFHANGVVKSNDPELAKSFLYMMDQNDATGITPYNFLRGFGHTMEDITTYVTMGGSVLMSKLAGSGMKAGIRQMLVKAASVLALDTAVGGAVGAADSISRQSVEVAAGDKEEIDSGQVIKSAAISAAATVVLGGASAVAGDKQLRKFAMDTMRSKPNPQGGVPSLPAPAAKIKPTIVDNPTIILPPPPIDKVEFKSRLRTEVNKVFEGSKKSNMSVSGLQGTLKKLIKDGTIRKEEVDWSGVNMLEGKGKINQSEFNALLNKNRPVPSLDKTVENSFAHMSFGGDNYREYVINIDKVGDYGSSPQHFGGKALEGGKVVGEGNANVGHLRMEDVTHGGKVGTMFLEGQSDIRKAQTRHLKPNSQTAKELKLNASASKMYAAMKLDAKASKGITDLQLKIMQRLGLDPQNKYSLDIMWNKMDESDTDAMSKKIESAGEARAGLSIAKMDVDYVNMPSDIAFTPFRNNKTSDDLLFRSAVMEAMNSGSEFIAWPRTTEQVGVIEGWRGAFSGVDDEMAKGASKFMTENMEKLAKSYGFKVEKFQSAAVNTNKMKQDSMEEAYHEADTWMFEEGYVMGDDWAIINQSDGSTFEKFAGQPEYEDWLHSTFIGSIIPNSEMNRIVFTPEHKEKWKAEGAAMYSFGAAAVVGASAQSREDNGRFK